jgi:hypothetical protein
VTYLNPGKFPVFERDTEGEKSQFLWDNLSGQETGGRRYESNRFPPFILEKSSTDWM